MKILSLYLQNYIGIYNGMGLREIFIDFSLSRHRTIVIRGDNGSGKSTIMKALSVFPDSNDSFIPDSPAKKEIVILDGVVSYTISFFHNIKTNGQRDVTKAYITKTVNGVPSQLNENGNVTSFKDILYDELGLDPNFESLSQLSTEDRGIADKKPAERKKFVNTIFNSLEVYNDIYKSLTKRASNFKNLINSITAKLGTIGDPKVIASNIEAIEMKINAMQDQKDQAIEGLANAKAKMEMLDPDGSIQAIIQKIEQENIAYKEELDKLGSIITSLKLSANISFVDNIDIALQDMKAKIDNLNIDNQIKRGQIESFLRERESEASELSSKLQRLQSFEQEWRYESICDEIASNEAEKKEIEESLSVIGLDDISQFSKDSFILALESLNRIVENVSNLKDGNEYYILNDIIEQYISNGTLPSIEDTRPVDDSIKEDEQTIYNLNKQITELESDIKFLDRLDIRPSECKIDSCPFIKDAVIISKQRPREALQEAYEKLKNTNSHLEAINGTLSTLYKKNACINQFSNFLRDIDRNKSVISKLPCRDVFSNKRALVEAIFRGDYSQYLESIYSYISYANLFDQYKAVMESLSKLYNEKLIYESKQSIVDEIQLSIDSINEKLSYIDKQVVPIQNSLAMNDKSLIDLQNKYGVLQSIADNTHKRESIQAAIEANIDLYNSNINKIKQINDAKALAIKFVNKIEILNKELNPLMHERDRLNHQMRLVDDYNLELGQLQNQYNLLETIRYYSSPTTGIQLVFMEMYMGQIIQTANNLLAMFFNGQFKILPFVINESEFRIPCAGEGIVNDDISSMSSAQIAMISMILSFSFLYNASSKYNILKLDEIDGPLDSSNRLMFINVLDNVMNMMGTEQCIMISHNAELEQKDADVILLRSSDSYLYTADNNIIWRY